MAYRVENTCETGIAAGSAVTAGNSDDGTAGTAFQTSKGATSTINYSDTKVANGTRSHRYTVAASESAFLQFPLPEATHLDIVVRTYLYLESTPSASSAIGQVRNVSNVAIADFQISSTRALVVRDAALTTMTGWSGGSAPVLSLDTEYRLEYILQVGTTVSNGRIRVYLYAGDSTSPIATLDTGTTVNLGTEAIMLVRFGRAFTSTSAATFVIDEYVAQNGTTLVGPVGANVPPTVTVTQGASQTVAKNTLTTISWTHADADGTVSSTSLSQASGPAVSLSGSDLSRTFTPTVAGIYVFTASATDNNGVVGSATHTVYVTDVNVRPNAVVSNAGAFTILGAAGSLEAAVADESDTTGAQSPDGPSGATITFSLPPIVSGPITVKTRNRANVAAPTISRLIELLQGSTVIASDTVNPLPTAATDHSFTTDAGQTAAITDRNALRVRITDTQA